MKISNIKIKNFRNIKNANIDFGRINIFTGKNASGKSNILLAIANSLRTDPDFSIDFNDNVVTHARGVSKTILKTKIGDLHFKKISRQVGGESVYFAPQEMCFKNEVGKSLNSLKHTLSYSGEFSQLPEESDLHTSIEKIENKFKESNNYKFLKDEIVYERNFNSDKLTEGEEGKLIEEVHEGEDYKNSDKFLDIFEGLEDGISSWVEERNFSSSVIYKFVTKSYDSEDYSLVMNRYKEKKDGNKKSVRRTPFDKATFILLLLDVVCDKDIYESFKKDLHLYTDGIVEDVYINTEGASGPKGEIKVISQDNPTDMFSVSAGTAVMIYFILLKNWLQLTFYDLSFSKPKIMIFDEIDSAIHPSMMHGLVEILEKISEKVQLFISTHSPVFIDCFEKDDIYWLRDSSGKADSRKMSNIMSYKQILESLEYDSDFLKKEKNSKLFVDGLMDSVFPNISHDK